MQSAHVAAVVHGWEKRVSKITLGTYCGILKAWLVKLRPYGVKATCIAAVPAQPWQQPRNVTIAPDELERLLAGAKPALRLYVLLCHDCALRSSSAAQASTEHYDRHKRTLTLVVKDGHPVVIPVTLRVHEALLPLLKSRVPFVKQLMPNLRLARWQTVREKICIQWLAAKQEFNLPANLRLHDLRRTMARNMYAVTGDVRAAQAVLGHASPLTTWRYLDQHVKAISIAAAQESAANWKGNQQ